VSAARTGSERGARGRRGRPVRTLADLDEFALIARIARAAGRAGADAPRGVRVGIGDDAAVLRRGRGEWAVSCDARVEDVHFRWRSEAARTIGRTALVAALSDLAAMGAVPRGFTCALAAPPSLALARFDGLIAGLLAEARRWGCPLVGGNLARARETSLALTVLGEVAPGAALRRRAREGDRLLVTGELGGAALARARAEGSGAPLRRVPTPRLAEGRRLARIPGIRGCIDVSDGLAADLGHLLGPGLGARIDPASVPRPRGFDGACRRLGLDPVATAWSGGDDYELLFTAGARAPTADAIGRRLGVRVSELGRVERGGRPRGPGGFRHFGPAAPPNCT